MQIEFWGATGTVTGSKFLVTTATTRVLIDCGLFQGVKVLRERNWRPLPFSPGSLDAVILTHAHLDHSGLVPALVRDGFKGPVYCTAPTADLLDILWKDSGRIQEEDADYANRKGFSKHDKALPLYTEKDALFALEKLKAVGAEHRFSIGDVHVTLRPAGHIIGAASVLIEGDGKRVLFSGDLGRAHDPLLPPPMPPCGVDLLVMESTYGDRSHPPHPEKTLREMVDRTAERGGVLLIPSFAVGRAQTLLYLLHHIQNERGGLRLPVYLNSPMATSASKIFLKHRHAHRLDADDVQAAFSSAHFVATVAESKSLSRRRGPMIIISASGMLTGGRVLHHLKALGPHPENTILLSGYQAVGTRGSRLVQGERSIKIHGHYVTIRADVEQVGGLSAHADREELVEWVQGADTPPGQVLLVHGEPEAADALRLTLKDQLGTPVRVAVDGETVTV